MVVKKSEKDKQGKGDRERAGEKYFARCPSRLLCVRSRVSRACLHLAGAAPSAMQLPAIASCAVIQHGLGSL